MSGVLAWFVRATRPFVRRLASAYGLRLDPCHTAQGQHPLIIEDGELAQQRIPRSTYFNTRSGQIRIGRETVFGEDVKLLTGMHMGKAAAALAGVPLHYVPENGRDIIIGEGCYIGTSAIVVGPVVIGDNAIIGAGSVVTKDVPAMTFVAGIPATIVRALTDS